MVKKFFIILGDNLQITNGSLDMVLRNFIVLLVFSCPLLAQQSDLDQVRKRVTEELLSGGIDTVEVYDIADGLVADGTWPDLNYRDTSRTGFQHGTHLDRMNTLARAYRKPASPLYGNVQIATTIDLAFNHWLANDYRSDNWWWNQIGTPWRVADFLLMMDERVSAVQRELAAPIVGRATLSAWGARPGGDLIKIAGIMGRNALFTRDTGQLQRAVTAMAGEIQFASERGTSEDVRGLQPDFGFHHRHDRVTSILSYGKGFASAFAEWAAYLGETRYAFPEENIRLLVDYYLDGISAATAFGAYPDPGAKNRGLSRPGALKIENTSIPKNLLSATDYRGEELSRLIEVRSGNTLRIDHRNTFFYSSEYLSHQRSRYFTSVRMYSDRNHSVEVPYNGEGIKNHYLADGANWLTRSGKEYLDIFPLLDYRKIPGTTVVQKPGLPDPDLIQQRGITDFVGGVSDGVYGAAAFDLIGRLDSLTARKSWFFFDEEYVCLGAGISSSEAYPVTTTIDQRWSDGEVIKAAGYVWHAGTGYYFLQPTRTVIQTDTVSGRWSEINLQSDSPADPLTGEIFKLWIDHGVAPTAGEYAYIVLPAITSDSLTSYGRRSAIKILENTPMLQAVGHRDLGIYQVVFYAPGSIALTDELTVNLATPGMVLVSIEGGFVKSITVADPTRKLGQLTVGISTLNVVPPLVRSGTTYTIQLPRGENAGRSVTLSL